MLGTYSFERASLLLLLIPPILCLPFAGCTSNPADRTEKTDSGTQARNNKENEKIAQQQRKLEELLDEKERKNFKPGPNSPGSVLISLFEKESEPVQFRGKSPPKRPGQSGNNDYVYLMLVSKEWAYHNRPVKELFLSVAHPQVKVIPDRAMNWLLKQFNKYNFSKFPKTKNVSPANIQDMKHGEYYMTLWKGSQKRRVLFDNELFDQMTRISKRNQDRGSQLFQDKSQLLGMFLSVFNRAGRSSVDVTVNQARTDRLIDRMAKQANPENSEKIEELLLKAETYVKRKQLEKARETLKALFRKARGTTYMGDALAIYKKYKKLKNEENKNDGS